MGKKKDKNAYPPRKRKFCGNQRNVDSSKEGNAESTPLRPPQLVMPNQTGEGPCASAKKLRLGDITDIVDSSDYNVIINFSILKNMIELVAKCPECDDSVMLQDDLQVRAGFAHRIALRCLSCNWINRCYTLKKQLTLQIPQEEVSLMPT